MPAVPERLEPRPPRLRVPRDDGAVLARPPLAEAVSLVRSNHAALEDELGLVRGSVLDEIVDAAVAETSRLVGETVPRPASGAIVATGHQPEPFHPGVWIKNFAVDAIAHTSGGIGLNVVADNDVRGTSSVRIPTGTRESPGFGSVPFDAEQPAGPWEEAPLVDRSVWSSFPRRLSAALADWGIEPLARSAWCSAVGDRLAEALGRVRIRTERAWGVRNLEVSLSRVCETRAFRGFVRGLLHESQRVREVHNEILLDYRRLHRLRSETHPVPALRERDRWTETPFWTWRAGETDRRPLFVRGDGERMRLADDDVEFATLPADANETLATMQELAGTGRRLRPRALATTMFLRMLVADLFVHGVGGAKYDEITDRLIARLFGIEPPRFLLLSGTRHLPLGGANDVAVDDERSLEHLLRDLRFNADRHLDLDADEGGPVAALVREKQVLVAEQHAADGDARASGTRRARRRRSAENRRRFERLREVNDHLAGLAADRRAVVRRRLERTRARGAANAVLTSREWSWWLHPEERLREWMIASTRLS